MLELIEKSFYDKISSKNELKNSMKIKIRL